jgi:SAM-dependent methyltransferase
MTARAYRYDNQYYDQGIGGFHTDSFPEISRRLLALRPPNPWGAVLDMGCGNGFYARFLRPHARVLHGIDSSDAIASNENRKIYDRVLRADLGRAWTPERGYDLVFSVEVIEHVEDYRQFLANAHAALAPGGTLFLTTTTYFFTLFILLVVYRRQISPAALADFVRGLSGDETARTRFVVRLWDYLTGHYHGFSRTQLGRGLADAGFEKVRIEHLQVQPVVPVAYLDQPYNGPLPFRPIVAAAVPLLRTVGRAINGASRSLDLYAPNVVVVARKRA